MTKQSGFTLIEIMISLMLGLIIIGATLTLYITSVRSSGETIQSVRLNHDLESAISLMMNDIKRAGFWGGAVIDADSRNNIFTATTGMITDIQIRNLALPTTSVNAGNCILYAYDADGDGLVDEDGDGDVDYDDTNGDGAVDDDVNEYYGFRLNGTTLEIRRTGTTTNSCTGGDWEEFVLGSQLNITALQFSLLPIGILSATTRCLNYSLDPPAPALDSLNADTTCAISFADGNITSGNQLAEKRTVNITITGSLDSDAIVSKTLTGSVQVRNDRLFNQP